MTIPIRLSLTQPYLALALALLGSRDHRDGAMWGNGLVQKAQIILWPRRLFDQVGHTDRDRGPYHKKVPHKIPMTLFFIFKSQIIFGSLNYALLNFCYQNIYTDIKWAGLVNTVNVNKESVSYVLKISLLLPSHPKQKMKKKQNFSPKNFIFKRFADALFLIETHFCRLQMFSSSSSSSLSLLSLLSLFLLQLLLLSSSF